MERGGSGREKSVERSRKYERETERRQRRGGKEGGGRKKTIEEN